MKTIRAMGSFSTWPCQLRDQKKPLSGRPTDVQKICSGNHFQKQRIPGDAKSQIHSLINPPPPLAAPYSFLSAGAAYSGERNHRVMGR